MTRSAHSVHPTDSLVIAKEKMQYHAIRHLPVVEDHRVVGVVSLGDLYAMESVLEVDPDRTDVASAMSPEAYTVEAETTVAEVVCEMAKRRIDSAIVTKDGALTGIFTATDACRLLGDILRGGNWA